MAPAKTQNDWAEANQRLLVAALGVLRERLTPGEELEARLAQAEASLVAARAAMPTPGALDELTSTFGLSAFERDVLLLCAGVELDSSFAELVAARHGDPRRRLPTFALAMAVLPDAYWRAIGPSSPLRRFRLVNVMPGETLTSSPLRIEERVLHALAGVDQPDERLEGVLELSPPPKALPPSQRSVAERIASVWSEAPSGGRLPVIELFGPECSEKRAIASAACGLLGLRLLVVVVGAVGALEEGTLVRLLGREAALSGSALLLDCEDLDANEPTRWALARRVAARVAAPVLVSARERLRVVHRPSIPVEVRRPLAAEQRVLWNAALSAFPSSVTLPEVVEPLVAQFDMGAEAIRGACASVSSLEGWAVWDACREAARPRLDDLAQRIEVGATWDDLVLPPLQRSMLRQMFTHVRQRSKVYEGWGFSRKGSRGLGVAALFAGASGTGKTMAAEVLAGELRLDLYRIDLSQVVSKYIGETEKNLRRVFDAAEESAAILLFDEADALFGERSEVKDSHDRYANIEVAYLLQRMETYRGISILTTNLKGALDPAFMRRIRFVVQFPFPGASERAEIWRRVFPAQTPTEGLHSEQLSKLNLTGGTIRNIAMSAAFLAAEASEPVRMKHLMEAAQAEYAKLELTFMGAELEVVE